MTETTIEAPAAPPLDQLAAALAKFQAEMPTVAKSKTANVPTKSGGSYKYTYADLADVTAAAMPLLSKHGLSFACLPGNGALEGMLLHESGQVLRASLPIHGGGSPQAIGSDLTYMRRYLLGCMTGIVTDDDDDGQAAERSAKRAPAKRAAAKPDPWPQAAEQAANPNAITTQQLAKMGAAMKERGITERADALDFVKDVIGREVESRNDLTKAEASKVIDALQTWGTGAEDPQ